MSGFIILNCDSEIFSNTRSRIGTSCLISSAVTASDLLYSPAGGFVTKLAGNKFSSVYSLNVFKLFESPT